MAAGVAVTELVAALPMPCGPMVGGTSVESMTAGLVIVTDSSNQRPFTAGAMEGGRLRLPVHAWTNWLVALLLTFWRSWPNRVVNWAGVSVSQIVRSP